MTLTISHGGGGAGLRFVEPTNRSRTPFSISRQAVFPHPQPSSRTLHVASAAKKLSSRTGRFDSKRRRSLVTTKEEQDEDDDRERRTVQIEGEEGAGLKVEDFSGNGGSKAASFPLQELPGKEPDFWEGPQWEPLGFFIQYMWAFGIVFALIACGIAVATYNEGATDFKETPAYKESIQSRELLEEPEASNSDVFESNPTEVAPSLE